jgi:putative ABC transport system permease protein
MIKHYFTTAIRNISRNRIYSLINLAGLTFGLVSCMLIFQYVIFENSADGFHANVDNIYRVSLKTVASGGTPKTFSQIHMGAGQAFKDEIPGVQSFARIRADFFQEGPTISHIYSGDKVAFKDLRSIVVDSSFLTVFTFPLVKGDEASPLRSPKSILITESIAERLFGKDNPIGKTVDYGMTQGVLTLEVTGVIKDPPANSHIQFDVIIPLHGYLANIPSSQGKYYSAWNFKEFTTYVALRPIADIEKVEGVMSEIVNRNIGDDLRETNESLTVQLQPMKSVYFDRQTDLGLIGFGSTLVSTRTGNKGMVYFFTIIALMSYINLSTIRSLDRAKEVGIRKVIGAHKRNLKVQFFLESTLMNSAALVIAIILVLLIMPYFNAFVQTNFTWASWFNPAFLILIGTVFVSGVILSGLYPAFVLSSFQPIAALNNKVGLFTSRSSLRKFLVVLQYAPAIALLVCTIVVYSQLNFMKNMDVGLEMNKLITIRSARLLPEGMRSRDAEAIFKREIERLPAVEGASYAGNQAGRGLNFRVSFKVDSAGKSGIQVMKGSGIDHDFASVFGLKLLEGQPFTDGMTPTYGDSGEFVRRVLVNETAVRTWGFKRNRDAVGRVVSSVDGPRYYIQGVLEDFNWSSVHKATDPVMLWYTPNNRFMTIKMAPGTNPDMVLAELKSIYDRLFPADVFHYEYAEDVYKRQYGEDEKFSDLFGIFSGLATLIASMGLFGLSAFSTERRSKEAVIRKVLGATVRQIVQLLSKEFIFLVFVSFVIASPIAWFVMYNWLQNFAFHINLKPLPFIVTGIGSLLIAMITVSFQAIKAAIANPVKSLRTE